MDGRATGLQALALNTNKEPWQRSQSEGQSDRAAGVQASRNTPGRAGSLTGERGEEPDELGSFNFVSFLVFLVFWLLIKPQQTMKRRQQPSRRKHELLMIIPDQPVSIG